MTPFTSILLFYLISAFILTLLFQFLEKFQEKALDDFFEDMEHIYERDFIKLIYIFIPILNTVAIIGTILHIKFYFKKVNK